MICQEEFDLNIIFFYYFILFGGKEKNEGR